MVSPSSLGLISFFMSRGRLARYSAGLESRWEISLGGSNPSLGAIKFFYFFEFISAVIIEVNFSKEMPVFCFRSGPINDTV